MKTVFESTEAVDAAVTSSLPPEQAALVLDLFNALDALKAQQQAAAAAHARAERTQSIETLVLKAMDNATFRDKVLDEHPRFRAGKLLELLTKHRDRYLEPHQKLPSRESVKAVLYQHGWLDES